MKGDATRICTINSNLIVLQRMNEHMKNRKIFDRFLINIYDYIKKIKNFFMKKKYYTKRIKEIKKKPGVNFFLIGTPEYCNMGDNAIALCEIKFLKDYFPNNNLIEVSDRLYKYKKQEIGKLICKEDIIFVTGGGFLGNIWMDGENLVRDLVQTFHNNRIIIFPQTVYFEHTKDGNDEMEITKAIWKAHDYLTIFVREKYSEAMVRRMGIASNKTYLFPDMVLRGLDITPTERKNVILLCLRSDQERIVQADFSIELEKFLKEEYEKKFMIERIDTIVWQEYTYENRTNVLQNFVRNIASSQLMVTDKLHGMIFAAITGTPCVVLNNITNKISGVYQWIEDLPYIILCEQSDVNHAIKTLLNHEQKFQYPDGYLEHKYYEMACIIKKLICES